MTIELYQNFSESNKIDKNISKIASVTGSLRNGSSIINPTFTINASNINIILVNYIYVVEWNRYYFVTDVVSIKNSLWQFSCHVDVLTTYKEGIRNLSGIIARQEYLYNLYLDDDKFLVNAQRQYVTKAFPNRVAPGNTGNSFILTIAGGKSSNNE